jgi:hypothetical protein
LLSKSTNWNGGAAACCGTASSPQASFELAVSPCGLSPNPPRCPRPRTCAPRR